MSKHFFSHLNSAKSILNTYHGEEPFHLFIKKYFANNKKFGSKDRKQITSLCYNYFRLGWSAKDIPTEEKILLGTFLAESKPSLFLETIKPDWNNVIEKSLEEKLDLLNNKISIENIFPFKEELSEDVEPGKFNRSFLIQPDLFLRVRPGNNKVVTGKLAGAGIPYKQLSENCIALTNSSKIENVIQTDKEAVVQDYNSQKVGELLKEFSPKELSVWDCCAASGGKSIMVYDINPKINLTVSDKREAILKNLHKRFAAAGIKKYNSFIADLTNSEFKIQNSKFDLILCDAPCTGSGTWARTPEQLFYFKKESIEKYASLQKKILKNVAPHLKSGGHLLYITCSVFKKENEEVVNYAKENLGLHLQRSELFKGYEMKADTLFAALFIAPAI